MPEAADIPLGQPSPPAESAGPWHTWSSLAHLEQPQPGDRHLPGAALTLPLLTELRPGGSPELPREGRAASCDPART